MTVTIGTAFFDDCALDVGGTLADDGTRVSFVVRNLRVSSTAADRASRSTACLTVRLQCFGAGELTVRVRGRASLRGAGGWAVVMARLGGRRMVHSAAAGARPFDLGARLSPDRDGFLRLSLLLLAQHDGARPTSRAACAVDAIDVNAVDGSTRACHAFAAPTARRAWSG